MSSTDYARGDTPLPGMEPETTHTGYAEAAARRTIAALHSEGLVQERHAVICAVIVQCARAVDASGKAYGVAQAAKELREAFALLVPEDEGGGVDDAWLSFEREFREAARGEGG
jgi:hypothetical protein